MLHFYTVAPVRFLRSENLVEETEQEQVQWLFEWHSLVGRRRRAAFFV